MTSFCANENSKLCNDCGHWAECPECGVCGLCRLYDPPSEQRTYCLKHYRQTFPGKGCDMCEMEARIEALEKDFAYHSELCTIQQARIDELEGALTAAYQEGWEAGKDTCVVDGDFSHDFKDSSTKALLGGEG